ncbi:MAG: BrnT family toxin [Betaproteobacteria bacterium]|nr:BrnT family toxin [Betaproteobacteria bacterium]
MITWNEAKRAANLAKHGIDLAECASVFDHPLVTREDARQTYGELRLQSLGLLGGHVVFMVWVERAGGAHIISCR